MDNSNLKNLNLDTSLLDSLTPQEKELALSILNEYANTGTSVALNNLLLEDYAEVPVDIETFVDDPEYLGNAWHDAEGKSKLYPYWRKELRKLFPNNLDTSVNNTILSGSRGRGKSEIASLIIAYLLHRVLCLKDPVAYFHLKPTEKLVFAFMNIKLSLAEEIGIAKFQNTIQSSPWFMSHGELEGRTKKVWVPKKFNDQVAIDIKIGSQSDDLIGLPVYAAFFDEISFIRNQDVEKQKAKAIDMINTAIGGMKTRFVHRGKNPTMLILASSKRSDKSFLEEHMKKKTKSEGDNVYISDGSVWEVKPKGTYSDKIFHVGVGNKFLSSIVIPENADKNEFILKGYKVIDVPIDFRADFLDDIDRALCDFAGISSSAISKYISGQSVSEVINKNRENPFSQDILTIGNGPDDLEVQYYHFFDINKIPKDIRNKPLFIHLDMSKSGDKTGIAGVFIKGKKPSVDPEMQSKDLFYSLGFSVSIKAPKGREISFAKNREFIRWLKRKGFNIKGITTDTYQSADLQQILQSEGYPASLLSVDRVDSDKICLLGDTKVKTLYGSKEIRDLIPGEEIYSYDIENDCEVITKFDSWEYTKDVNEYYEILTVDNSVIRCTGNHLILTQKGYIRADNLTEDDSILQITLLKKYCKIKSINKISCESEPVYDIGVPKYENFILDNGLVVHNCKPYSAFKSAIYEKRIELYESMLLIQEITELERNIDSGKVDHPDGGSKDASDAVCGAMYNASKHAEEFAYDYGESAEYLLRVNEDYSITEMDKLTLQLEEELKNMGSVFTKNKKPNHPSNVANETRDYYLLTDDIIIL